MFAAAFAAAATPHACKLGATPTGRRSRMLLENDFAVAIVMLIDDDARTRSANEPRQREKTRSGSMAPLECLS
jgi:hypothetical protein